MNLISSRLLIPIAVVIAVTLFWFRPGGVEGPRPDPVAVGGKAFDHSIFSQVLKTVVDSDGHVDYAKLRQDPSTLDRYLGMLRAVSPKSAPHRFRSSDERLAYYINAYNAFVMAAIRDHCPIDNVSSLYFGSGFFWRISFLMGGQEVSLTTIESERIRGVMQRNPIVHLALVKGAKGFLPLGHEAYEGRSLKAQFDSLARRAVDTRHFVHRNGKILELSSLFEWYAADFVDTKGWLKGYAPKLVADQPVEKTLPFDWSLNGHCHAKP